MADTPNAIITVEDQVRSELAALAHRHVNVSYSILGILALVLALGGVGAWVAVKFADAQLARAEAAEARYETSLKSFQDSLAAHDAARAADTAQQKVVVQVQDQRNKATDAAIVAALDPKAPVQAIAAGLGAAESDVPSFGTPKVTSDGNVALEPAQAQQLTAQKLDRDRLAANLTDETKLYTLESAKSFTLGQDLGSCQTELKEGQTVIAGYKKAARSSRFKKAWHGALTVGAILAAAYVGHRL